MTEHERRKLEWACRQIEGLLRRVAEVEGGLRAAGVSTPGPDGADVIAWRLHVIRSLHPDMEWVCLDIERAVTDLRSESARDCTVSR